MKENEEQGGRRAGVFGRQMEDSVEHSLDKAGLRKLSDKEKLKMRRSGADLSEYGSAWYARNVLKYTNLYGLKFYADFIVFHEAAFPSGLLIEVKTQETSGSVDEKYVFTVLSLIGVPDAESWIVFEGEGARPEAIDWMKKQGKKKTNTFSFMSFAQFRRALYDRLRDIAEL